MQVSPVGQVPTGGPNIDRTTAREVARRERSVRRHRQASQPVSSKKTLAPVGQSAHQTDRLVECGAAMADVSEVRRTDSTDPVLTVQPSRQAECPRGTAYNRWRFANGVAKVLRPSDSPRSCCRRRCPAKQTWGGEPCTQSRNRAPTVLAGGGVNAHAAPPHQIQLRAKSRRTRFDRTTASRQIIV